MRARAQVEQAQSAGGWSGSVKAGAQRLQESGEAFAALAEGADVLKMFPAEQMGPAVVKAWLAVLPAGTLRSEERRVGKECRSRWSPYH